MMDLIKDWILKRFLISSFKQIEKQNFATGALQLCFKVEAIRRVWGTFIDSVISVFEDAIDEAKSAKSWK